MSIKRTPCAMLTCALVIASAGINATQVRAQEAEMLPPIVVEGASIAVKPVNARKTDTSAPTADPQNVQSSSSAPNASAAGSSPPSANAAGETAVFDSGDIGEPADAGLLLPNQGTAVSVITGQEIERQKIRYTVDVLRGLPGVSVNTINGRAGLSQVRIRGNESNHTLVLIDGVELNSASDGDFDFSNLSVEDIDRIEVLRGSQSALYGSGAIGGVINITTRSGRGPLTLRTRVEAGSFNSQNASGSLSAGNDRAYGTISYNALRTDGYNISPTGSEKDGSELSTFLMKGGVKVFPNVEISGLLRRTRKDGERDSENFLQPVGTLITQFDTPSEFLADTDQYGLDMRISTFEDRWLHSFTFERSQISYEDTDRNTSTGFPPNFFDADTSYNRYRYTSTLRIDTPDDPAIRHFVTGLAEQRNDIFQLQQPTTGDFSRDLWAVAGEVRGEYYDQVYLTASARHEESNVYGDFNTWRVSGAWAIPQTPLRLHASAGTGIKLPTFLELYGFFPPFTNNPNLIAEEATSWDVGIEFSSPDRRFIFDATYFDTEVVNEIGRQGFGLVNFEGAGTRQGVELVASFSLTRDLSLGASYTFLDAQNGDGSKEERRPEHLARLDVNYAFDQGRGNVNLATVYNGEMFDYSAIRKIGVGAFDLAPVDFLLDDYVLVTAAASYDLSPGVQVYGRVENALNQNYQEVFGFETAGIAAYAGLRFTYVEEATRAWAEGR